MFERTFIMNKQFADELAGTLRWMITQFDYQNKQLQIDTNELMKEDSPEMALARKQLVKLEIMGEFGNDVITPTDCEQCVCSVGLTMCSYTTCEELGNPKPNPCPSFNQKVIISCDVCRQFVDLTTMRGHEYKCKIKGDITGCLPNYCLLFDTK